MDFVQDYAALLPQFLPPSLANPLLTFLTTTFGLFRTLSLHLTPLLERLTTAPDLASLLTLLVILFVSLKILDMAYRAVLFWVNLVCRLVFWGAVAGVGLWIWQRGVEGFVEDVRGLVGFWGQEVERYRSEVRAFQVGKEEEIRWQAAAGAGAGQPGGRW